jgi:hypothetical protein
MELLHIRNDEGDSTDGRKAHHILAEKCHGWKERVNGVLKGSSQKLEACPVGGSAHDADGT